MKYYKILRADMTHHGFKYQEGLNIDTEPFNETQDCGGGLFFSDAENILSFCDYGNLIAEVEIPNSEQIVQVRNKYKSHAIVLKNIKPIWTVDTFKYLMEEGINIHVNNDWVFYYAATNNYLEVEKFLIDNGADIHYDDEFALQLAAYYGHLETVEYLIGQGANIHAEDDYVLRCAAEYGHLDIVKYLAGHGANIHAADDYAFKYGTSEVLTYLNSILDK